MTNTNENKKDNTIPARLITEKLNALGLSKIAEEQKWAISIGLDEEDVWITLDKINIDPSETGMLSAMFKSITLEIKVAQSNGIPYMYLIYRYEHPCGSNGVNVRLAYSNGEWLATS